jgi:drug/metabolite transporter (DMT)-like permease
VSTASGLIAGERPSAETATGVVLALVAVGLIGLAPPGGGAVDTSIRRVLPLAGLAGLALGCVNVSFAATSSASGISPLAVSRGVALSLLIVLGRAWRRQRTSVGGRRVWAIAAGMADVAATASVTLALQRGSLVQVGVLASMFPAVTVLLARVFLQERVGRGQLLGLACALAAVGMMSAG